MQIYISHHVSKHDCETCGGTWHNCYELTGDLGNFESGERAYCFGTVDGDFESVIGFIFTELQSRGYNVSLPENPSYVEDDGVDWDSFHKGLKDGKYTYATMEEQQANRMSMTCGSAVLPDDVRKYLDDEHEYCSFFDYDGTWKKVLEELGIYAEYEYSEDEDWDDDPWGEDNDPWGDDDYEIDEEDK